MVRLIILLSLLLLSAQLLVSLLSLFLFLLLESLLLPCIITNKHHSCYHHLHCLYYCRHHNIITITVIIITIIIVNTTTTNTYYYLICIMMRIKPLIRLNSLKFILFLFYYVVIMLHLNHFYNILTTKQTLRIKLERFYDTSIIAALIFTGFLNVWYIWIVNTLSSSKLTTFQCKMHVSPSLNMFRLLLWLWDYAITECLYCRYWVERAGKRKGSNRTCMCLF